MRLDPFTRDYRTFMTEFVEALEAKSTRFYLDTSLLMWLIRLGAAARKEFIGWCDSRPRNSVRVPVWAAHELHRHLIKGTVRSNVQATLKDTVAKYDEFARLASERADEEVCLAKGYAGRTGYIGELEQSIARLNNLVKVVEGEEERLSEAAEEVISFVNAHVLSSDIRPFVKNLSLTGSFRFSHDVPPGFHDDKKGGNAFGDVIIWEEMILDLEAEEQSDKGTSRDAVLISRDQKTDWVSSAPLVRNLSGESQKSNRDQELDVTLPLPLLVHELVNRAHGNRLYITQPGLLASALDFSSRRRKESHAIGLWLASSHRPDYLRRLAGNELALETSSAVAVDSSRRRRDAGDIPPSADTAGQPPLSTASATGESFRSQSLEVQSVLHVMEPTVAAEVRQYQDALPAEQSILVAQWAAEAIRGELPPLKFGRILADLSIAKANRWPEQLPAILEHLSKELDRTSFDAALLAILASAYFDRYGKLLRQPHVELATTVLPTETNEQCKDAFRALNRFLMEADAQLPYTPGSGRLPVSFSMDLVLGTSNTPRMLRDVRVGKHSALADPLEPGSPRRLSSLLGRSPAESCTGRELRMLIAREYLIPADLLKFDQDNKKITWSAEAGLVILDTETDGGLSSLADEESDND